MMITLTVRDEGRYDSTCVCDVAATQRHSCSVPWGSWHTTASSLLDTSVFRACFLSLKHGIRKLTRHDAAVCTVSIQPIVIHIVSPPLVATREYK
jgi:hypothetical protein